MPRLETSSGWSRFKDDVASLFSPRTGSISTRLTVLQQLLLRSVRISLAPSSSSSLSTPPLLPLRIRPAFVILNILDLILLGILGFHPRGQTWIRINDKILHFVCFFLATAMFYMIWDVDEPARASYVWRNASLILTAITCFLVGGIGSEIVQSLLPYKVFQLGDIVANLSGSSLGLFFSYHLEKRYRARRELERLYAPLDIEDYGDEEEEELHHVSRGGAGGGLRSSLKQPGGETSKGKKKTRFDGNIWDDSVDIDTAPSQSSAPKQSAREASSSSSTAAAASGAAVRKQELFSIDDEDDDEEEDEDEVAGKGTAETNVWKQADS
ncbi:uncharacterized protein SPSC_01323 [Sporisorium scitamineum]|uniref:VanZ-like domain-containing protein n=1 Tax=Sporisorium scitamineum TaxID=49012 RepID=A0A0F7RT44_9BASI|nr:hypothetical protein [Sporisorium scitamineum]CDU22693.1 uncharacterized protein SPSC_01323 [Sporisorium scitamineum]